MFTLPESRRAGQWLMVTLTHTVTSQSQQQQGQLIEALWIMLSHTVHAHDATHQQRSIASFLMIRRGVGGRVDDGEEARSCAES